LELEKRETFAFRFAARTAHQYGWYSNGFGDFLKPTEGAAMGKSDQRPILSRALLNIL
jgi:hypothetical protein